MSIRITGSSVKGSLIVRQGSSVVRVKGSNTVIHGGIYISNGEIIHTGKVQIGYRTPESGSISKKIKVTLKTGKRWQKVFKKLAKKARKKAKSPLLGEIKDVTAIYIHKESRFIETWYPSDNDRITKDQMEKILRGRKKGFLLVTFENILPSMMATRIGNEYDDDDENIQYGDDEYPVVIQYPTFNPRSLSRTDYIQLTVTLTPESTYEYLYDEIRRAVLTEAPEADITNIVLQENDGYETARFLPKSGPIPESKLIYVGGKDPKWHGMQEPGVKFGFWARVSVSNAPQVELPDRYYNEETGMFLEPWQVYFDEDAAGLVPHYGERDPEEEFEEWEEGEFMYEDARSRIGCHVCGNRARNLCGGCLKTKYCGTICQTKDWNKHKKNCK